MATTFMINNDEIAKAISNVSIGTDSKSAIRFSIKELEPGKSRQLGEKYMSKLVSISNDGTMSVEANLAVPADADAEAFTTWVDGDTLALTKSLCASKADVGLQFDAGILTISSANSVFPRETLAEERIPQAMPNGIEDALVFVGIQKEALITALKSVMQQIDPKAKSFMRHLAFVVDKAREGKELSLFGTNGYSMDLEYVSAEVNKFSAEKAQTAALQKKVEENLKKYKEAHDIKNEQLIFAFPYNAVQAMFALLTNPLNKDGAVKIAIGERQVNVVFSGALLRFSLASETAPFNDLEMAVSQPIACEVQVDADELRQKIDLLMLSDGGFSKDMNFPVYTSLEDGMLCLKTKHGSNVSLKPAAISGDEAAVSPILPPFVCQTAIRSRAAGNLVLGFNGAKGIVVFANGTVGELQDGRSAFAPVNPDEIEE